MSGDEQEINRPDEQSGRGADYLEQDLVMTKDGRLVVLHDHYLDRVTDVNQFYSVLYRQADVDGVFTDFPDKAVQFLKAER